MCSNCAGDYENPDMTAHEEMAVYDPHEDDRGRGGSAVGLVIILLAFVSGIGFHAAVHWFLHHAK